MAKVYRQKFYINQKVKTQSKVAFTCTIASKMPTTLSKLSLNVAILSKKRATGEWLLNTKENQWKLYLFHGRLLYVTGGTHRFRRWKRAISQHCPDFVPSVSFPYDELWEYQILSHTVAEKQLSIAQAKAVIRTTVQEVLFCLASLPVTSSHWISDKQPNCPTVLSLPLSAVEVEQIITSAQNLAEEWQKANLGHISPELSPVWKKPPQKQNPNMVKLLNGENTLWDIACQLRRSVAAVTISLFPLINRGAVELKELTDIAPPSLEKPPVFSKVENLAPPSTKQPLIACIDDSPVVGQALEKILVPAGYRLLKITQPLREMSILVKHKPDLIFLDLLMPDANGYSICKFLRKTPMFQDTPIIILTSRDSIVNRGQAKLTGATDFLTKPPERQKVLQTIQKYLNTAKNS